MVAMVERPIGRYNLEEVHNVIASNSRSHDH